MQVLTDEADIQSRVEQLLGITIEHLARVTQSAAGGRNSATRSTPVRRRAATCTAREPQPCVVSW